MKELTCNICKKVFSVRYLDLKLQTGLCQKCQLDYEIDEAKETIENIQNELDIIMPEIKQLKEKKDQLADLFYAATSEWTSRVRRAEAISRKAAIIQYELNEKLGKQKSLVKKKSSNKSHKTREKLALEALQGFSKEELLELLKNI